MPAANTDPSVDHVLDASVAAAWCLPQQQCEPALELLRANRARFWVPTLWLTEISNVFLVQERRRIITSDDGARYLALLAGLTIQVEEGARDLEAISGVVALARRTGLTVYDAQYLSLAVRRGCGPATLDRKLSAAARSLNIPLSLPAAN